MPTSEDEIIRLFRIRKTVMQMLKDRNYLVVDSDIDMTKEEFVEKYGHSMKREDLTICKAKKNDSSDQICVFFAPNTEKVGIARLRTYMNQMKSENVLRAILVVQDQMTTVAKTSLSENATKFNMEIFQDAELLVNVTEHFLVPVHQVLTDEEKKSLLERYTLRESQVGYPQRNRTESSDKENMESPVIFAIRMLPRIQVTDPIARYYGLKRGQVVKIIRSSDTAGRYVTFRYIV